MKKLFVRKNKNDQQPAPVFFTEEQKERMWKTEGCYRWGESNGKKADPR